MKIHIVQKGDTLWEISKQYGVQLDDIIQANPHIASPDYIMPGMKIMVPSSSKKVVHKSKKQEQVAPIAHKKEQVAPIAQKKEQVAPKKTETKPSTMKKVEPKKKTELKMTSPELGFMQLPTLPETVSEKAQPKSVQKKEIKKELHKPKTKPMPKPQPQQVAPSYEAPMPMPMPMPMPQTYYHSMQHHPCYCPCTYYYNPCAKPFHHHHNQHFPFGRSEGQYVGHLPGYYMYPEQGTENPTYEPSAFPPYFEQQMEVREPIPPQIQDQEINEE